MLKRQHLLERAKHIKLAAFDVDGVMTDGSITYTCQGHELKTFNALDGFGIKLLQNAGIVIAIITARSSEIIKKRAKELGIKYVFEDVEDKLQVLSDLTRKQNIKLSEVAYLGDDLKDLSSINAVGFGMTVPNGHKTVQEQAHGITQAFGGKGAVREFCDFILEGKGLLEQIFVKYK